MPITVADLKFFTAERMTDEDDGGGQMTGTAIQSGVSNQIFDDLSDVDFAVGDVSLRKVYAAVTSAGTEKYLDAGVVVFKEPANAQVSVLITSTGDFYDERAAIQSYIESYLVAGPAYPAFLYGTQLAGSRTVTLFARLTEDPPAVNTSLVLVESATTQFVRVLRILSNTVQTFTIPSGSGTRTFQRRIIVLELSEALRSTFHGAAITDEDSITPDALLYSTLVADAARYYGIRPVIAEAATGAYSLAVDDIYARIVPVAQVETPVLDVTAASERPLTVAAADGTVGLTVGDTFGPGFTLYLGRALMPGTLSITVAGGTLEDDGGQVRSGTVAVGTVDYERGQVVFAASSPSYSGSKTVTFRPAAALARVTNSFALPVTEATRYRTYVTTLSPPPSAGTLMVDYRSQGNWYRLYERGNGQLTGASSNYGAGTVNFETGSVSLTLGALPDLYSSILFLYGSGVDTRALTETRPLTIDLATGADHLAPGSATLAWASFTLTDQGDGTMTGTGGSATLDYVTGQLHWTPTTIPAPNTTLAFTAQQYSTANVHTETFTPTADESGVIALALAHTGITEASLAVQFRAESDLSTADYPLVHTINAQADGAGGWKGGRAGAVNAAAGTLTLDTHETFGFHTVPVYGYREATFFEYDAGEDRWGETVIINQQLVDTEIVEDVGGQFQAGSTVTVTYTTAATASAYTATLTLSSLSFSLKPAAERGETLVPGSFRAQWGAALYQDVNGRLLTAWNPATGTGTDVGGIDYASGQATLSTWASAANSLQVLASAQRITRTPSSRATFRIADAPVAVGSFSLRATLYTTATVLTVTADAQGVISGSAGGVNCYGRIDYGSGVVDVYFGSWITAAGHEAEPWYQAGALHEDGKILYPGLIDLSTLRYNAVTYSTVPLDSSIIGLDPVRLPSDGRIPIFRDGQLVLAHHTATLSAESLSPTQTVDCGRERLYRVAITDAAGLELPPSFYQLDRAAGTVTMAADLNLTGYTAPYTIAHTIADLGALRDADLSGQLSLTRALTHTYPVGSRVSGVLYVGSLQARYAHLFAQSAWTGVWSDTRIGDPPLAQYNDALYPIAVSNAGAYQDRILIRFTSSTAFQVIGENLGVIATGNINEDCAPFNQLTQQPYFTVDYRGWGSGWATGNCVRFNLIGANYPLDLIRAVQPSAPSGAADSVQLLLIGNVDA